MGTYTTNYNLYKPVKGDTDYISPFATSMNTIDAKLTSKGAKVLAAGDTTPSVANTNLLVYSTDANLTITGLDDGVSGQIVVITNYGANTLTVSAFFYASAGAFAMGGQDTLTLINYGGVWLELARSTNS